MQVLTRADPTWRVLLAVVAMKRRQPLILNIAPEGLKQNGVAHIYSLIGFYGVLRMIDGKSLLAN